MKLLPTSRLARWSLAAALLAGGFAGGVAFQRYESAGPALTLPTVVRSPRGRVVGEFEHHDALMLGCNELIEHHPQTLVQIARALVGRIHVIALVTDTQQQDRVAALLRGNGVPADGVSYFVWPARGMWVQDFGPQFVVDDHATIVDFAYNHPNTDLENLMSMAFATWAGMPMDHCELSFDGGNLLSNGRGHCVSTTDLVRMNEPRNYAVEQIGGLLRQHFNFNKWTLVRPLAGEPLGHADMFMTFVAANVVVVGQYTPEQDAENAMILDENAATLAAITTPEGPLRVVRIPMPGHDQDRWRTYTNVIFANGTLLVPQYPDFSPELDRRALEIYRQLLPNWHVVGINAATLIAKRGALHCVSRAIPLLRRTHEAE